MKIQHLFEEDAKPRPSKSKAEDKSLDDLFKEYGVNLPTAGSKHGEVKDEDPKKERELRTASKEGTQRAASKVRLDDKSAKHLADLHKNMPAEGHEDPEETTELIVRQPRDVPKVMSRAMVAAGFQNPEFHLVSNLPGNMSAMIRRLGKALFAQLTSTPTDQISMIANLGGHGPNTKAELNAVAAYLKKDGKDLGPGKVNFDQIMPGYEAKTHNFEAEGIHFMVVNDHAGHYIYAWPVKQSKLGRNSDEHKRLT